MITRYHLFVHWRLMPQLFQSQLVLSFPFRSIYMENRWRFSYIDWKTNEKKQKYFDSSYRRFWYHVLTCVSLKFSASATSLRSATDKYFWHRNFRSRYASCECVNAVRRRRGFRPTFNAWNPDLRSDAIRLSFNSRPCFGNISLILLLVTPNWIAAVRDW